MTSYNLGIRFLLLRLELEQFTSFLWRGGLAAVRDVRWGCSGCLTPAKVTLRPVQAV